VNIEVKTLFKGIFLINLVLIILTGATSADLFVTQTISRNKFTATTIDFSERDTANNNPNSVLFDVSGLVAEGFKVEGVRIKKDGRENFKYRIIVTKTIGNDLFCQSLQLSVLQNWQIKYQGSLLDFSLDSVIKENGLDDWIFYINLANNDINLTHKVCDFDFIFRTYRNDPDKLSGFWDEEILTNHISSGVWTLQ